MAPVVTNTIPDKERVILPQPQNVVVLLTAIGRVGVVVVVEVVVVVFDVVVVCVVVVV